jgi:hypothetical protein
MGTKFGSASIHLVAEALEVPGDPLALGARLEQGALGRKCSQNRGEPLAAGDNAALRIRPFS